VPVIVLGTTVLLGFVVAIVPVFPIEPYVVAMAATTHGWAVPIGLAAGLGQAAGKTVVLLGARGVVKAAWIQRLIRRWSKPASSRAGFIARVTAGLDRPVLAAPIVLLAAGTGIPPLAIVVFYAAKTRMSWLLFFLVALAGRSLYFTAIALVPSLFTN
jgi:hypothetical protein